MSGHAERIPRPQIRTRSREVTTSTRRCSTRSATARARGSYLVLMSLWYYAAESKIIAGGFSAPAGVIKQFKARSSPRCPAQRRVGDPRGVRGARVPRPGRQPRPRRVHAQPGQGWLLGSSIGSLLVLAMLAFGESMTGQHANVPSFFTYIAATVLVIGMVRSVPPYRSERWLSSKLTDEQRLGEDGLRIAVAHESGGGRTQAARRHTPQRRGSSDSRRGRIRFERRIVMRRSTTHEESKRRGNVGPVPCAAATTPRCSTAEVRLLVDLLGPFGVLSRQELARRADCALWHEGTFGAALRAGIERGVIAVLPRGFVALRRRRLGSPRPEATRMLAAGRGGR